MEGAISSVPNTRIAVVTGGNKGIGFEVCWQLASGGITVVLTARDETRGAEAVEKLIALGVTNVVFHQLDVTDTSSIATLVDFLKTRFGKLDILFAGMDFDQMLEWMVKNVRERIDSAKKGVQTNYYGTKHVTEAVLPLLQSSSEGRIVNVSSIFGLLRLISNEKVRRELSDIDNMTEERLDELLNRFLRDFEADALEACGWPMGCSAYKVAKAAMNAYSRMLARRHPALRVNCAHPGYSRRT
ncbi:unnamed protein product [Triticum turgidum subsp. durum]|uniref:Uncharacterized protein n=1 Tax=Triticum turgidum subsp. durum TaxID=4567 RepID=A0A9R1RQ28_TRITD|nr:unnamed protein product [Triticum turgidum subsp. durum]